ncbi:MAG: Acryloyl-CoA reductase electron transfer subunit gamma [bacterium ADurb.Bin270]|nr:MAG: Acryloyl-CoA reductase electron transfer subunit gamma [bacterium ADurb.Bin270]
MSLSVRIIVTIKQVPSSNDVRVDPVSGTIIREGLPSVINPEDKNALELALCLRESVGAEVVALSMGPTQARRALCEAMAIGADRGILLCDKKFAGADTWATAYSLSCAVKKLAPFDLILCGRQAIDGDTAQTGPQLSEFLGIPQATCVEKLELHDGFAIASSDFGDVIRRLQFDLPALVTVTKNANFPRYASISGIAGACGSEKIEVWNAADVGADPSMIGLSGSPTRVKKMFSPRLGREGRVCDGSPSELAGKIFSALLERKIL